MPCSLRIVIASRTVVVEVGGGELAPSEPSEPLHAPSRSTSEATRKAASLGRPLRFTQPPCASGRIVWPRADRLQVSSSESTLTAQRVSGEGWAHEILQAGLGGRHHHHRGQDAVQRPDPAPGGNG